MSINFDDLIQPTGEIEPDLFADDDPGGSTQARVEEALRVSADLVSELSTTAEKDAAQTAFTYAKLFRAAARVIRMQPIERQVGQGESRRFDMKQADQFDAEANRWQAVFDGLLADDADDAKSVLPLSRAVRNEVVW